MKRSLLLLCLAAVCCGAAGCGARNQNGNNATATGAGNNAGTVSAPAKADAVFAREAVERLLDGDTSVAEDFDWENLKVPGAADAGSAYRELPDDENREGFRQGFIEKFSESFKASGATVEDLKNWREESKQGETTIVAVDTVTGKTMRVFVVRRDGRQQVSELSIE